jgi:membrane-bound lytic murein transglycosylase D
MNKQSKPDGMHCNQSMTTLQNYFQQKNRPVVTRWGIVGALVIIVSITARAQAPQVPHKMQFAGMTLTIRDDARREIQKDVDALTLSPRHFMIKVERAKTYFPIIEKIFQEERVPVDFKYLVLQESALISDAVSPSNAVGFWQFKDYTALEMGMRVDKQIDERMNIVSASRGAAKYIKKNNFYFNNWLYALQAYQMGAGAAMKIVDKSESGAKHMEITSKTYWYVKKYLAHKVAFEDVVNGTGQLQVITFENKTRKSLADLAKEISVDEVVLKDYNKWVRSGVIPEDRTYAVLIPLNGTDAKLPPGTNNGIITATNAGVAAVAVTPVPAGAVVGAKINGLRTIVAMSGETAAALAARAGVELTSFLKWNDLSANDAIHPGGQYFVARKRARASQAYHKVLPGENLWFVSQKYGVQVKRLKRYNRLGAQEAIKPGQTLWLSSRRPKDAENIDKGITVVEVDSTNTFGWTADPVAETVTPQRVQTENLPDLHVIPKEQRPDSIKLVADTTSIASLPPKLDVILEEAPKDSVFAVIVKKTEHIVRAGETLYAIAQQNGVGVMDLVNWNGLNLQDGIKPGQLLKLSDSQVIDEHNVVKEPVELVHEVKASDTLYSVARKYGVTIKELMEWNEKKDFSVSVGEKLKIIRR